MCFKPTHISAYRAYHPNIRADFQRPTKSKNFAQVWATQNAKQFTAHAISGKCSVGDKSKPAILTCQAFKRVLTGKRTHARHARGRARRRTRTDAGARTHARARAQAHTHAHAGARTHTRGAPRPRHSRDPERAAGHNALRVRCILRIPTSSGSAAHLIDGEALRRWRWMHGDS